MTDPNPLPASGEPPETRPPQPTPRTALLDPPDQSAAPAARRRIQLWMHRISVFLFVLSAPSGVLLIILPWTPGVDRQLPLALLSRLRAVVSNGFFRGVCSGLGVLDIWIGFWEAIHYHEQQ